jgi:hypothetical protein
LIVCTLSCSQTCDSPWHWLFPHSHRSELLHVCDMVIVKTAGLQASLWPNHANMIIIMIWWGRSLQVQIVNDQPCDLSRTFVHRTCNRLSVTCVTQGYLVDSWHKMEDDKGRLPSRDY